MFPGGQQALQEYLKEKLPHNPQQPKSTEVRLVVSIIIDKEGKARVRKIIEEAPFWYIATTTAVIENMPAWKPGEYMGEPINVFYALPLTFRK